MKTHPAPRHPDTSGGEEGVAGVGSRESRTLVHVSVIWGKRLTFLICETGP